MGMDMASSQAKVVLCCAAGPDTSTTRFLDSIRQCTKAVPYGQHQTAISASLTVRTRLGAAGQ
jgi:hypothetical protein